MLHSKWWNGADFRRTSALLPGSVAAILFWSAAVVPTLATLHAPAHAADDLCTGQACVVAGAETDDAATIGARSKAGSGPANGIASDRRLKQDVKPIGALPNGVPVYSFRFEWEDRVRVGLVAQDLLERPDQRQAVLTMSNGLLGIDYASLGLRMATETEWMAHGYDALKADYFAPEIVAEQQLPRLDNRERRK